MTAAAQGFTFTIWPALIGLGVLMLVAAVLVFAMCVAAGRADALADRDAAMPEFDWPRREVHHG